MHLKLLIQQAPHLTLFTTGYNINIVITTMWFNGIVRSLLQDINNSAPAHTYDRWWHCYLWLCVVASGWSLPFVENVLFVLVQMVCIGRLLYKPFPYYS